MSLERASKLRRARWVAVALAIAAIGTMAAVEDRSAEIALLLRAGVVVPALGCALIFHLRIRRIALPEPPAAQYERKEKDLVTVLAVASAVALFDLLLAGQGVWSWGLSIVGVLYYLPRALSRYRERKTMALRLKKALVVLAIGISSSMAVRYDVGEAHNKAQAVIGAIHRYKLAQDHYPRTLDALVPKYLSEVPSPRLARWAGPFRFSGAPPDPTLSYVVLPPFSRRVFHFATVEWAEID